MNTKHKLSMISCMLLLVMFFSCAVYTPLAYADPKLTDISGHWAQKDIETLIDLDIIAGYADNTFRPNNAITRAEFMKISNKSFGFTDTAAAKNFIDVPQDRWFAGDIAIACTAGYISGYEDGTMRPEQNISRQEAAAIICKILGLNCSNSSTVLAEFSDRGNMPSWSRESIAAVIEAGYMSGYPDRSFRPTAAISRAEVAAVMNKIRGLKPLLGNPESLKQTLTYSDPSSYGPPTGMNTIDANVNIDASGITFRNTIIEGDLIVSEKVGSGEVTFDNVVVKGNTTIKGGGPNSIHIIDCEFGSVIVDDEKNTVRIKIEGDTSIGTVTMNSGGKLQEIKIKGAGFSDVIINIPQNAVVELDGTFETLNLNGEGAHVKLSSETIVTTLNVNAPAVISGAGQIETANVNSDEVIFELTPNVANIAEGVTAQIGDETITGEAGGTVFESNASPSVPAPGGGGFGGGGGSTADATVPLLSAVSTGPIIIGQLVSATSNEDGILYLVPEGTPGIIADITAAVSGSNGSSTPAAADTAQNLSTAGLAAGNYIVYAADEADNISAASDPITLEPVLVSSINVTAQGGNPVIDIDGGTLQMLAEVLPANASNQGMQWAVEDGTGHAAIDQNGLLTAGGRDADNGTVTVRAQAADGSGIDGTLLITISNQVSSVESISVSGTDEQYHVPVNGTLQMLASVLPEDYEDKSVTWSVNNSGLASISETGFLTALNSGIVTVTATAADGSGVSGSADVVICAGDGTEGNPYTLYTASCIDAMRGGTPGCEDWGGDDYYIMMNDIDISEYSNWEPYGFSGGLDGNNHIISGLTIDRPLEDEQGLFSFTIRATIQNLGLTDVNILGQDNVGSFAGECTSTNINNCYASGEVYGRDRVGALVGFFKYSYISGCYVSGEVHGRNSVGGLMGTAFGRANIYECYSTADVVGETYVGGLMAAANDFCRITFCHSSGNVQGNNNTGGLIGCNGEGSSLIYCYSHSTVLGGENTGGLAGYSGSISSISCCYSSGDVTGTSSATGGLIGLINQITMSNCYSSSDVTGAVNVGGLAGDCEDCSSDIISCYASGNVSGTQNTGGLIGTGTVVENCAAVNPQIIRTESAENSFHRVAGISNEGYLTTNYANSSMTLPDSIIMDIGENGRDGQDKTLDELKQQAAYIELGWDFDTVWDIDEGSAYPTLRFNDMPIILWGAKTFYESPLNNGSIYTAITATLANETFAAGPFTEDTHYTVNNVPPGLTVDINRTSDTKAVITLTGTAENHEAEDSVYNLEISFADAAFTGGDASAVLNSSQNDLRIIFETIVNPGGSSSTGFAAGNYVVYVVDGDDHIGGSSTVIHVMEP